MSELWCGEDVTTSRSDLHCGKDDDKLSWCEEGKMMIRNLRPVVFWRQTTRGWVFLPASHFYLGGRPTLTVHQTLRCYRRLLAPRLTFLHGGDGGFSGSIPVSV
ncbi:hypothetical protein HID58_025890 [Brassica napus]|uniref:Uncharacterized protein n=3 Tax=Brassica TaxID=3705 RepID=M4D726_BRACM|nr:hypothetical protein HID58_025890 [Brassica napus]CAF2162435.1 unnamed protein product [Brassica napus]